jgi:hypothetical protein
VQELKFIDLDSATSLVSGLINRTLYHVSVVLFQVYRVAIKPEREVFRPTMRFKKTE